MRFQYYFPVLMVALACAVFSAGAMFGFGVISPPKPKPQQAEVRFSNKPQVVRSEAAQHALSPIYPAAPGGAAKDEAKSKHAPAPAQNEAPQVVNQKPEVADQNAPAPVAAVSPAGEGKAVAATDGKAVVATDGKAVAAQVKREGQPKASEAKPVAAAAAQPPASAPPKDAQPVASNDAQPVASITDNKTVARANQSPPQPTQAAAVKPEPQPNQTAAAKPAPAAQPNQTASVKPAVDKQPLHSANSCDVQACSAAYKSFRASDCTYQPYEGPRQACVAPPAANERQAASHRRDNVRRDERAAARPQEAIDERPAPRREVIDERPAQRARVIDDVGDDDDRVTVRRDDERTTDGRAVDEDRPHERHSLFDLLPFPHRRSIFVEPSSDDDSDD